MKTSPLSLRSLSIRVCLARSSTCRGAIVIGLIFWNSSSQPPPSAAAISTVTTTLNGAACSGSRCAIVAFPPPFTWLPLTTLDPKDYVDHHLLFHFFQIPFTWFGDLRLGAKISATNLCQPGGLFVLLAVGALSNSLLVRLVAGLLACSAPFLYRMNMAKAPPFAIIYLVIGIHLFFTRKYWPLLAHCALSLRDLRHVCVAGSRGLHLDGSDRLD